MKRINIKEAILSGDDVGGHCYFCNQKVGSAFYCFGCGKFICFDCENHVNPPMGKHKINEHRGNK